jgi:ankyrin repeat protein
MIFALPFVLLGLVLLVFVGRAWMAESGDRALQRQLIDLALADPAAARRLLSEHPELLGARYVHDQTALHYCAAEGHPEGVRFFADAGVPVDAPNAFGDTALVDAVADGDVQMARLLLRLGADPNAPTRTRDNLLHDAAKHGRVELAAALLEAGARADYVTRAGGTVWDAIATAEARREELLKLLARHGVTR